MAMQILVLPPCTPVTQVQPRQAIRTVGGGTVSQLGPQWGVECSSRAGAFGPRSPLQGVRFGGAAPLGLSSKRGGEVVRAEQVDVGTATTTPAPLSTELNVGGITEVDKDSFWPIVKGAGEKVVVLDMYTQWCGPCKLMLPKIVKLASELDDVIFLKLDCNKHNKLLAKELGIRVVPTFKIYKHYELKGEVCGAKYPDLVTAIDTAKKA